MDRWRHYYTTRLLVCLLTAGLATSFRGHFRRRADLKLTSTPSQSVSGVTVDGCADTCGAEDECRAFEYNHTGNSCHIFHVNSQNVNVSLVQDERYDLYERVYLSQFTRISNHHLPVSEKLKFSSISLEECAWKCIVETTFDCHGFNHMRSSSVCFLLGASSVESSLPAIHSIALDFYERTIDYEPMNNFLNFGSGMLWPISARVNYNATIRGISLEQCAQRCLEEHRFHCFSFDYIRGGDLSSCLLSSSSVMRERGYLSNDTQANCNHFERIDLSLQNFQATLYARSLLGPSKKLLETSAESCARFCLDEESFVCRSFDYQVEKGGTCLLSSESVTSGDNMAIEKDSKYAAHHFEMKPFYECGRNLSAPSGELFSPGWPQKYPPYEECSWYITVPSNQVITIKFLHLELGDGGQCSESTGDRLLLTEFQDGDASDQDSNRDKIFCLPSKTKQFITKSNRISLSFLSDRSNEDLGFKASYSADWTCNTVVRKSPGEFASPGYPLRSYSPDSKCTWRLLAPDPKQRVQLHFSYFRLQEHHLGQCTESTDHLKILDGGTTQSSLIGIFCGIMPRFYVISSGRELLVQFKSFSAREGYKDERKRAFRAQYSFEEQFGSNNTFYDGSNEDGEGSQNTGSSSWNDRSTAEEENGRFRIAMWTVVVLLGVLEIALIAALLLFARHHKKQMMKYRGEFNWPWKTEIVSMKLMRSLMRVGRQDGDANSNNLITNAGNPDCPQVQDVGISTADCFVAPQQGRTSRPSKFGRSSSGYKRLNEGNIYLGDANIFP